SAAAAGEPADRRARPEGGQGRADGRPMAQQAPRPEAGAADLQRDRGGPRGPHRAEPVHRRRVRRRRGGNYGRRRSAGMKLAYWPGCVSRGFTPELHGSMAAVAPKLGLELVELDRANCCGAGVIAEHNQELADTLNARTFALAQRVDGADFMMNICSTCQGAQSECQQRLDANTPYRERVNETLAGEGLRYERGIDNRHLLWLMVEEI